MTDGVGTTKTTGMALIEQPSIYHTDSVREVRARAASVQQDQSPEELAGVVRLNQILGRNQPLRADVPRGFYLNIRI